MSCLLVTSGWQGMLEHNSYITGSVIPTEPETLKPKDNEEVGAFWSFGHVEGHVIIQVAQERVFLHIWNFFHIRRQKAL